MPLFTNRSLTLDSNRDLTVLPAGSHRSKDERRLHSEAKPTARDGFQ